jgi:hypothetical protein
MVDPVALTLLDAYGEANVVIQMKEDLPYGSIPFSREPSDEEDAAYRRVWEQMVGSQRCTLAQLLENGGNYRLSSIITNSIFATLDRDLAYALAARSDVAGIWGECDEQASQDGLCPTARGQ